MPRPARSRAKRIMLGVSSFILVGLLINLAIAWGLSLIPHRLGPGNSRASQVIWTSPEGEQQSLFILNHAWFGVFEQQYHTTRRSRSRDLPSQISIWWAWSPLHDIKTTNQTGTVMFTDLEPANPDSSVVSRTHYGFPTLTLQCRTMLDDSAPLPGGEYLTRARGVFFDRIDPSTTAGKPAVWPHAQHIWLPYHPIWSGLIINTLFYALLALLIARLARSVRHARRMHRGRCPFCAYELRFDFSDGCSECGWRRTNSG